MVVRSLSISSSSGGPGALLDWALRSAERLSLETWVYLVASAAALALAFLLVRRLRGGGRRVAEVFLVVAAVRFLLLYNPAAWAVYKRVLSTSDIGRRQAHVLMIEARSYLRPPAETKILAVGSSQTWALYGDELGPLPGADLLTLPGMAPVDYVLYRDYIARYHPRTVLLYVSEGDAARSLTYNALRTAPPQGAYWLELFPKLARFSHLRTPTGNVMEMLVGEIFPEYKYGFVFRGLAGAVSGERAALQTDLAPELPDEERLRINVAELTSDLSAENIPLQLSLLQDFLAFCRNEEIGVVIVEGQYHPLADTEENRRLGRRVRGELEALAGRYENVHFIPRTELMVFTAADFRDGLHVTPDAAHEFITRLATRVPDLAAVLTSR
jgi:hypothetical protein